MQHLAPAIARFREFLKSWNDDDVIDEESGFTAADGREMLTDLDGRYSLERAGTSGTMADEIRHAGAGRAAPDKRFATNGE